MDAVDFHIELNLSLLFLFSKQKKTFEQSFSPAG